jgi:Cu2+-exporting ATPase
VRDALSRRSPIQRIADRVVGISVPLVLILGGLTVAYWAQAMPFDRALLVGLAVLVAVLGPSGVGVPVGAGVAVAGCVGHGISTAIRR